MEAALKERLPISSQPGAVRLNDALAYSVLTGGKRMRPLLTLLAAKVLSGDAAPAIPAACAVEYLHTSSLILDDLPAMDDADMRRGNPALHKAFGEDIALLTSIALLNQSYALFGSVPGLIEEAARCIGTNGMIGGQMVDLGSRELGASPATRECRNLKTSALLRLTLTAGAISCAAPAKEVAAMARFGECLGAAYQICDDLHDLLGESCFTGKPARQDDRHLRPTNLQTAGAVGAQQEARRFIEEGKRALLEQAASKPEIDLLFDAAECVVSSVSAYGLVTA
ncbi:MAG: polyprenyl synthetase family protein [Bryobacteraceae bacterium]|nr:polyprenyl synthetase family protein [Bryobacteraceae bacterium]